MVSSILNGVVPKLTNETGHAWVEIDAQGPAAIDQIKNHNPDRYKAMHFISGPALEEFVNSIPKFVTSDRLWENYKSFKDKWWSATVQSLEIITATSHALRSGQMHLKADRVVLAGLCQSADLIRKYILEGLHLRLPDGYPPFEGFMPCQSDGGEALPDLDESKIIEILGELEIVSVKALYWTAGIADEPFHRHPDSNSFRLYEVAGMAHRETRYLSVAEKNRLTALDLQSAQWSTFSNSFVLHAIFDAMDKWITTGAAPPRGTRLVIDHEWEIERDRHGNALGGLRTVHTDVPTARLIDVTPKLRPHWHPCRFLMPRKMLLHLLTHFVASTGTEIPFTDIQMWIIYKSIQNYQRLAGKAIQRQLEAGFLLIEDAEVLRRDTVEQITM